MKKQTNAGNNQQLIAKTFAGLEDVLAKELNDLGAKNVKKLIRAVSFSGDNAMMYRANYRLRTALCILKPIAEFEASNEDELYKGIGTINWANYMKVDDTLSVSAVTYSKIFTHSKYVALKTKDAIVDQFRRRTNKRPDVDTMNPTLAIDVHVSEKHVTVLLNSSGDPLFKRGYRQSGGKAPINEVLAAGMLMLSGWNCQSDLMDPMCGSGTILIEAAMMAYGIAPGSYRSQFAFEKWNDFDADLFEQITEEDIEVPEFKYKIYGSDISPVAVRIAKDNIRAAFLSKQVDVHVCNFFDTRPKSALTVVTNPPYGERLQPGDMEIFYRKMSDKLKIDYLGSVAWIIGSNPECMKYMGLHPEKKIKLFNGPLECTFRKFSIYEGSKRDQFGE